MMPSPPFPSAGRPSIRTRRVALSIFLVLTIVLLTTAYRSHANGTSIDVTTTEDDLVDNGNCSLREAIRAANRDTPVDACAGGDGADTITLPDGTYTLHLEGPGEDQAERGDLDITGDLTIIGTSAEATIIDGNRLDRVFEIHGGIDVAIHEVTIRNGLTGPGNGTREFTGASAGGGIANQGGLRLENVVVTGNMADGGDSDGTDAFGGGIFNNGTLVLVDSQVDDNRAHADNEGGGTSEGGGIYNSAAGTLTLEQSTIANNSTFVNGGGLANHGDAILHDFIVRGNEAIGYYWGGRGGGLYNSGEMALEDGTIGENYTSGRHGSDGGGILNEGTLTADDLIVQENRAESSDYAGHGGGIWNSGLLTLRRSTVSHNRAEGAYELYDGGHGGGIWNWGELTVNESTVHRNVAALLPDHNEDGGKGGGITNYGTLALTASTVSENTVEGMAELDREPWGGGIMNHREAVATIHNSTISGNVVETGACAGRGSALLNQGRMTLSSSTITGNRAEGSCDGEDDLQHGAAVDNNETFSTGMTIIAGNANDGGGSADCAGRLSSEGYNLLGETDGCNLTGDSTGNLTDVMAELGPLQDNGGPTFTHALLADSPAIDAGASGDDCPSTDQRGVSRPQDGDNDGNAVCDIGAYEFEGSSDSPTATPDPGRATEVPPTRTGDTPTPPPSAPSPTSPPSAPSPTSSPSAPSPTSSPSAPSPTSPPGGQPADPPTPSPTPGGAENVEPPVSEGSVTPTATGSPGGTPQPTVESLFLPQVTR